MKALDAAARSEAIRRLEAVERREGVRILLAVESGSRAWGFPSPDSDYDVRFVYVRPVHEYVRIEPPRDVIEEPIEGVWDVNGWDLRKGLIALLKGNAVFVEWLRSPLVYCERGDIGERLRVIADRYSSTQDAIRHYLGLVGSQYVRNIKGRERVRLKTYFYSARPALALAFIRATDRTPPMDLRALLDEDVAPAAVRAELQRLIELKAVSHEIGEGPRQPVLDAYIEEQRRWALSTDLKAATHADQAMREAAEAILQDALT